jgi:hypothetical protein
MKSKTRIPKISEKELSYTTNSLSSGFRNTVAGIAIELLIIPGGIEFKRASLRGTPQNSVSIQVKAATKMQKSRIAELIDLKISFLFRLSSLRSRLASITIMIRPRVPMTGRTGRRFGISILKGFRIYWIAIPSAINKITPGIFEYFAVMSKKYERITIMQSTRIM